MTTTRLQLEARARRRDDRRDAARRRDLRRLLEWSGDLAGLDRRQQRRLLRRLERAAR